MKMGHFEKVFRSKAAQVSGALTVAIPGAIPSPTILPMPILEVRIGYDRLKDSILVTVMADTGAQTCCAGPDLLHRLNLKYKDLSRGIQLSDFANRKVESLGAYWCEIQVGGKSARDVVHFTNSANRCILSLAVYKKLGLVHEEFSLPITSLASSATHSTAKDAPATVMHSGPDIHTVGRKQHSMSTSH